MARTSDSPLWLDKDVFTTGEAAAVCGLSQQTIIRCFDNGRLNGFRVPGSKFRRIPRAELIDFMKRNQISTDSIEGPRRILVVDDDRRVLDLIAEVLKADPRLDVHTAATGYDAGLLTHQIRPHLVLLDVSLPDVDGRLVCKRIKATPEVASTRVVIISGALDHEQVEQLERHGADGFLRKPFDGEALRTAVNEALEMVR
jgi:excisionase family DNA binding protein